MSSLQVVYDEVAAWTSQRKRPDAATKSAHARGFAISLWRLRKGPPVGVIGPKNVQKVRNTKVDRRSSRQASVGLSSQAFEGDFISTPLAAAVVWFVVSLLFKKLGVESVGWALGKADSEFLGPGRCRILARSAVDPGDVRLTTSAAHLLEDLPRRRGQRDHHSTRGRSDFMVRKSSDFRLRRSSPELPQSAFEDASRVCWQTAKEKANSAAFG